MSRRGLLFLVAIPFLAGWGNTPCSQSKGGINHCEGARFICNDGSVSASKKDCRSYFGGGNSVADDPGDPAVDDPAAEGDGGVGRLKRPKGAKK